MFCPFRRVPFLPLVDRHLEVLDPLFEVGLSMTLIGLLGDLQRNWNEWGRRDPYYAIISRPDRRGNQWDLDEFLQTGGRAAFQIRLVLAATLGASYGIYGPPFELCIGDAIPGTEEYRDSEKYQVRVWDRDGAGNIRDLVTRINRARHEHPALQFDDRLRFHDGDDERLLVYSKTTRDLADVILVVVNLDPHRVAAGWLEVPLADLGIAAGASYEVHDVLNDARYVWNGARNYVRLDPAVMPAHVFVVDVDYEARRRTR